VGLVVKKNIFYKFRPMFRQLCSTIQKRQFSSLVNTTNTKSIVVTSPTIQIKKNTIESLKNSNQNFIKRIQSLTKRNQDSFFLFSKTNLNSSIKLWNDTFPFVTPYYALKPNSDITMIKELAKHDFNFDCASVNEVKKVRKYSKNPVIFSHPIPYQNLHTIKSNIAYRVYDNIFNIVDELPYFIRIKVDDSLSKCKMSSKYGAHPSDIIKFFATNENECINNNFRGFSFHIGSGSGRYESYESALTSVKSLVDIGSKFRFNTSVIDIGGGFTQDVLNLRKINQLMCDSALQKYKLVAEPGRFFAESSQYLIAQIVDVRYENGVYSYYINDSVYQNFSAVKYDHMTVQNSNISVLRHMSNNEENCTTTAYDVRCILYGKSCDGEDVIASDILLPKLNKHDVLIFHKMGSYTNVSASTFNGFNLSKVYVL